MKDDGNILALCLVKASIFGIPTTYPSGQVWNIILRSRNIYAQCKPSLQGQEDTLRTLNRPETGSLPSSDLCGRC